MILFNKAVLSQFDFPYPMFLTTWHMLLATVITQILSKYTDMLPGVKENKVDHLCIKESILPVSLFFAISLVLSNKSYIYLSVSFIQMLKAMTPVAVLFLSYIFRLERASIIEVNIVSIISLGVVITSIGELEFSLIGFIFQLSAIFAESSRLVLTNVLMKKLKLDSLSTLYYIAPLCLIFVGTACLVFEAQSLPWERFASMEFIFVLILNGMVAFTLNIAVVMLIGNTSALVLTLAGIFKDLLLVFLSMLIFKSPVTLLQYVGYGVALLGLNLHKEFKKSSDGKFGQPLPPTPAITIAASHSFGPNNA